MRGDARVLWAAALGALVLLLAGCGGPPEEEQVKEAIKKAVSQAEKRDLEGFKGRLAPDYVDFQGRDRDATLDMVEDYLRNFRGVVIHVLGADVEITDPGARAAVTTDIVLSSGAAEAFRKLVRFTGDYFRFELELEREAESGWRIAYAEWRSIPLSDLLPESLGVLKELFPGF